MNTTKSKIKFDNKNNYSDTDMYISEAAPEYNWTPVEPQIVKNGLRSSSFKCVAVAGVLMLTPFSNLSARNHIKASDANLDDVASFVIESDMNESQYLEEIKSVSTLKIFKEKSDIIKDIISFKILENNWDGYGAIPAEIESATNAVNFVSYLDEEVAGFINDVFPNPNGTISFLWENDAKERLSLEIGNNTMSYYLKLNSQKPQFFNHKHINKDNATELSKLVKTL
jgi:hypothetical protein